MNDGWLMIFMGIQRLFWNLTINDMGILVDVADK